MKASLEQTKYEELDAARQAKDKAQIDYERAKTAFYEARSRYEMAWQAYRGYIMRMADQRSAHE